MSQEEDKINDKIRISNDNSLPESIRSVVKMYPSNQVNRLHYGGLPHVGNALHGAWSIEQIRKAAEAYENYSLSTNLLIDGMSEPDFTKVRLGGGSPGRFDPYKDPILEIQNTLNTSILSDYPLAAGDNRFKSSIIKYYEYKYNKHINENNILFTHSSTQGFTIVMEAILDYGDVVVMTAPNYGLFTFIPERAGGKVKLLQLKEEDDWKINTQSLNKLILDTNRELREDYDQNRSKYIFRRSDNCPRVAVFVNYNPHNPTGVVYSKNDLELLTEISDICNKNGVFVIDDLAYSGLEYDKENIALPFVSLDRNFDNIITLYTLSKAYGLASFRSGLIIGNEIVTSLIRDRIFQNSDSLSILQASAISSTFKIEDG